MFIALILFFASFVQGAAGFGLALVAMPLLVSVIGIRAAAPLIALISVAISLIMLFRYRAAFNLRAVTRLSLASLTAVPLGVFALRHIDATLVTTILGVVIIAYALYDLSGMQLPALVHQGWAYGFGFVSGLLSGAYNTGGPPVIIYGRCRRWPPAEFKGNLQGFFLLNSMVVIAIHALSSNFTPLVWQSFLTGAPATILGLWAGFSLDKRLDPQRFRQIVLVLLLILGGRLLIAA